MKDWLKIGEFSRLTELSPKALRLYEKMGILTPKSRGENNYRFYSRDQLNVAKSIGQFKTMGFPLEEIKILLGLNVVHDLESLQAFLKNRLEQIVLLEQNLNSQKDQIISIITSLENQNAELSASERKYIMSHLKNISVVVTGIEKLDLTAKNIVDSLNRGLNAKIPIYNWTEVFKSEWQKPYILVVPEDSLTNAEIRKISPDVVVINNLSNFDAGIEKNYLSLYTSYGPHITTVFNADDSLSVKLAANEIIRKGKTFYFSKNKGVEDQIKRIGGVVSDGEEIRVYGFNLKKDVLKFKLKKPMSFSKEVALLASMTSLLDVGLERSEFIPFEI